MKRIHLKMLLLGLVLTFSILQSTTTFVHSDSVSTNVEQPALYCLQSYVTHPAITINNNSDFENQGWPGEGTEDQPYLIQNLNISLDTDCITIRDTDVFFTISGCYLGAILNDNGIGIRFTNVTHGQVDNCTLEDKAISIYVETSSTCQFSNITTDSRYGGIYIGDSDNCDLIDSVINKARASFSQSQNCIIRNVTFNGGGLAISAGFDLSEFYHDITDVFVNGKPFGYFVDQEGQSIDGADYGQIILVNCNDFLVHDGNFSNTTTGVSVYISSNCTVEDNISSDNLFTGISINRCDNLTINNNTLTHNGANGISAAHMFDSVISNNTVERCYEGIWLVYCNNSIVNSNFVTGCTDEALEPHGDYLNVTNNIARDSDVGIHMPDSDHCYIIGNEASGNTDVGIEISSGSEFCKAIGNIMFSNGQNADDDGTSCVWDDSISLGNLWGDYTGGENYSIPGTANSIDRFPMSADVYINPPIIDQPADTYYELGTISHNITWSPSDYNPTHFVIEKNGVEFEYGDWKGGNISIDVGSQGVGAYNYTLFVFDSLDNSANDSVLVIVEDTIAPSLNHPLDVEYFAGESGNYINWTPFDLDPASYSVFQNESMIQSGDWTGEDIVLSVDGLSEGVYNYTIVVFDTSHNTACDTVIVTVTVELVPTSSTEPSSTTSPTTSPTPTTPPDPDTGLQYIPIYVGGIALIVILVVLSRRR